MVRRALLQLLFVAPLLAIAGLPLRAQESDQLPPAGDKPLLNLSQEFGLGLGQGDGSVTLTAGYKIVRGTREGTIWVKAADITPGWHIYSITQKAGGPQKSEIKVADLSKTDAQSAGSFEVGSFEPDVPPRIHNTSIFPVPSEEHENEVTWTAPLKLAEGVNPEKLPLKLSYGGQICKDDGSCIPLREELDVKFEGYEEPPANPGEYRPDTAKMVWKGHLEPRIVTPGGKAKLVLTATPDQGWHLYPYATKVPATVGSQPTLVVLTNSAGWRQYAVTPSAIPKVVPPKEAGDETQTYYDGPVTFTTELLVPKDTSATSVRLTGFLGFQTCNASSCLLPSGAKFSVVVPVGAVEEAGELPLTFEEAKYKKVADLAAAAPPAFGVVDPKVLAVQLGLSLLGGLLLNLMPCVLPVLGLKILSFAQQGGQSRAKVLALNIWYSLGLLAVFMVLAAMSAFLNLNWGEQFTQTWFKVTMLVTTFAFGLSFLSVWEIPIPGFASTGHADTLQQQEGAGGAFFKGIFTTVLGVSCSGPLLGGVFGYTLTQAPLVTFLIFFCIGLGMASPFLLVALIPQLQRLIPKPGEWMNTFKHLMGFLLLGVCVYLFSTLGKGYYIATLSLLTGVGFGCWCIGRVPPYEDTNKQIWAWGSGLATAALIGFLSFQFLGPLVKLYPWQEYSEVNLAIQQSKGKTVMIDFTADWCLNCQLNTRQALNTQAVKQAVEKNGVIAMEADWTEPNAEIKAKLGELNSRSIPILAIYPAGRPEEVIILRDIVTAKQVVKALEEAGPSKSVAAAPPTIGVKTTPVSAKSAVASDR